MSSDQPVPVVANPSVKPSSSDESPEASEKHPKKSFFASPVKVLVLLIVLAILTVGGLILFRYLSSFQETDDAQIDGHLDPISSRINGTVIKVNFEDNQYVKQGDVLVEIDPRDYQVAVEQAQANLAQAQAQLKAVNPNVPITQTSNQTQISTTRSDIDTAQAGVSAAQKDYQTALANIQVAKANALKANQDVKRYQLLIAKQEISQQQFDTVIAAANAQNATLAAQQSAAASAYQVIDERKAALAQAISRNIQASANAPRQVNIYQSNIAAQKGAISVQKALLDQALLNLSYCKIKAPANGVVGKKSVEIAQRIEPGQQLLTLTQTDDIWVTANYKENQLKRIHPGQRVTIHVDTFGKDLEGTVENMPGATGSRYSLLPPENATGNYVKVVQRLPVRIRLNRDQDPHHLLRPGMSVEPKIWLDKKPQRKGRSDGHFQSTQTR